MTAPERRLRACVERWPDAETCAYDPRCCRFPKSCSATVYDEGTVAEEDLEPAAVLLGRDGLPLDGGPDDGLASSPSAERRSPMTARTQLVVLYHDHQTMYFPVGPDCGWKVDNASRCIVVGKFPRTYIPLDTVRSFDIEAYGGDAPESADEFDDPETPLERLHVRTREALGKNTTAERKARDEGRDGDALLAAARVDAFDWVLQRIDEEVAR